MAQVLLEKELKFWPYWFLQFLPEVVIFLLELSGVGYSLHRQQIPYTQITDFSYRGWTCDMRISTAVYICNCVQWHLKWYTE